MSWTLKVQFTQQMEIQSLSTQPQVELHSKTVLHNMMEEVEWDTFSHFEAPENIKHIPKHHLL